MLTEDFQGYGKLSPYSVERFGVFSGTLNESEINALHVGCTSAWTPLERMQAATSVPFELNATSYALEITAVVVSAIGLLACLAFLWSVLAKSHLAKKYFPNAAERWRSRRKKNERVVTMKTSLVQKFDSDVQAITGRFTDPEKEKKFLKFRFENSLWIFQYAIVFLFVPFCLLASLTEGLATIGNIANGSLTISVEISASSLCLAAFATVPSIIAIGVAPSLGPQWFGFVRALCVILAVAS